MNAAHLRALLDALGKLPRPSWPHVLNYIHTYARAGVLYSSINGLSRSAPDRPALTEVTKNKRDEAVWALRNLRLIALDTMIVPGAALPGSVIRVVDLSPMHVEELAFALSRIADKPRRAVQQKFARSLEASEPREEWYDVRQFFVGERLRTDELVAPNFGAQIAMFPRFMIEPVAKLGGKVHPSSETGGQGHLGSAISGGGPLSFPYSPACGGSHHPPRSDFAVDRIVRDASTTATSSEDRGGFVEGEEGTGMVKKTMDELLAENSKALQKGTAQYKPGSKAESTRLKNRNGKGINNGPAKTVTSRMQNLKDWEHWRTTQPILNKVFPEPCITLTQGGDIDYETSNPDAIQLLEFLQKGCKDLLKHKIGPNEVPYLLLQAWRAYARLFNLEYSGPGDMRMIPPLRLAFRRMTAGQTRMTKGEILSKMAGFVFRMDYLRRNRKGEFFPNQEWVAIYSPTSKYATAWQDALLSDPKIRDPMAYMLGVEPFVKPTNPDGSSIEPPPKRPAERLAEIRLIVKAGGAEIRPMHDMRHGEGAWDKLSDEERADRVLDTTTLNEMHRLEKELEGDPAEAAVRKP